MASIDAVGAREILDSRGNPTVEVEVALDDGTIARAAVPSGASTGQFEAHRAARRRQEALRRQGRREGRHRRPRRDRAGAGRASRPASSGSSTRRCSTSTARPTKSRLGANAILGVSLAVARAAAESAELPLFRYVGGPNAHLLPVPMMNILNGGAHADTGVDVQEFMVAPIGAPTFQRGAAVGRGGLPRAQVGAEGARAWPPVSATRAASPPTCRATATRSTSSPTPSTRPASRSATDIALALDVAATEFYADGAYAFEGAKKTADEMAAYYAELVSSYPLVSIEDPMSEEDWDGWTVAHRPARRQGADRRRRPVRHQPGAAASAASREATANALLVKVNQIGTLTETLDAVSMAHRNGYRCMMSHRSGETEDTTIADLAVATDCGQIKTGAPARSERVAKYNQLLRIEEELDDAARYAGARRVPASPGADAVAR